MFLRPYRGMLLLGCKQSKNLQKWTNLLSCMKPNALWSLKYDFGKIAGRVYVSKLLHGTYLDWNAHIKSLLKKLKTSFAIIKRISSYIPPENHKNIYHTLFESHLSYCISVWGGTKKKFIDRIFTLQKSAIRYLFGDYESFLDKFNTAARTRPIGEQCLDSNFYCKGQTIIYQTKYFNSPKSILLYGSKWTR